MNHPRSAILKGGKVVAGDDEKGLGQRKSQLEYCDYILVTLCSGMGLLDVDPLRWISYASFSELVRKNSNAGPKERKE